MERDRDNLWDTCWIGMFHLVKLWLESDLRSDHLFRIHWWSKGRVFEFNCSINIEWRIPTEVYVNVREPALFTRETVRFRRDLGFCPELKIDRFSSSQRLTSNEEPFLKGLVSEIVRLVTTSFSGCLSGRDETGNGAIINGSESRSFCLNVGLTIWLHF